MPLHLTKIAFQSEGPASLRAWLESHADEARLTTRYLPKRLDEMTGGSLYWIHGHALVGRSPLLGFQETGLPKRAHQGWRYLEDKDAPPDLGGGEADDLDAMPPALLGELTRLGLV